VENMTKKRLTEVLWVSTSTCIVWTSVTEHNW